MAKEAEHVADDGTVRKTHYGKGRQPWDDIKDLGWAAPFAAGNALKYVRRFEAKNGEDDLEKGRWYFVELKKLAAADYHLGRIALNQLMEALTLQEYTLLAGPA